MVLSREEAQEEMPKFITDALGVGARIPWDDLLDPRQVRSCQQPHCPRWSFNARRSLGLPEQVRLVFEELVQTLVCHTRRRSDFSMERLQETRSRIGNGPVDQGWSVKMAPQTCNDP